MKNIRRSLWPPHLKLTKEVIIWTVYLQGVALASRGLPSESFKTTTSVKVDDPSCFTSKGVLLGTLQVVLS